MWAATAIDQIPTDVVAILGVIVVGLITCILLLVRTLAAAKGANAAVNQVDGPTISANVRHLVHEVDKLSDAQEDFARRGWARLAPPLDTAAGLTSTINDMNEAIAEGNRKIDDIGERLAKHDEWERGTK